MEKNRKLTFHLRINVKIVLDLEQNQDLNLFLVLRVEAKAK